jgi:hypothetical protein
VEGDGTGEYALTLHRDSRESLDSRLKKGDGREHVGTSVMLGHAVSIKHTGSVACPAYALGPLSLLLCSTQNCYFLKPKTVTL